MENHLLATLSQQQVLSQEQQQSLPHSCRCPRRSFSAKSNSCSNPTPCLKWRSLHRPPTTRRRALRSMTTTGGTAAARMIPNSTQPRRRRPSTSPTRPGRAPPATKRPSSAFPPPNPSGDELLADLGCLPLTPRQHLLVACLVEELNDGASSRPVRDAHALLRAHPQGGRRRERDRRRVARSPRHPSEHGSSGHRHRRPRRGPHEADRAHRALHHACRRA